MKLMEGGKRVRFKASAKSGGGVPPLFSQNKEAGRLFHFIAAK